MVRTGWTGLAGVELRGPEDRGEVRCGKIESWSGLGRHGLRPERMAGYRGSVWVARYRIGSAVNGKAGEVRSARERRELVRNGTGRAWSRSGEVRTGIASRGCLGLAGVFGSGKAW